MPALAPACGLWPVQPVPPASVSCARAVSAHTPQTARIAGFARRRAACQVCGMPAIRMRIGAGRAQACLVRQKVLPPLVPRHLQALIAVLARGGQLARRAPRRPVALPQQLQGQKGRAGAVGRDVGRLAGCSSWAGPASRWWGRALATAYEPLTSPSPGGTWPAGPPPCCAAVVVPPAPPHPAARCCWCAAGCPRCTTRPAGCRRPPAAQSECGASAGQRREQSLGSALPKQSRAGTGQGGSGWLPGVLGCPVRVIAPAAGVGRPWADPGARTTLPATSTRCLPSGSGYGPAAINAPAFCCPAQPRPRPACIPTLEGTRVFPSTAAATASSHSSSARGLPAGRDGHAAVVLA